MAVARSTKHLATGCSSGVLLLLLVFRVCLKHGVAVSVGAFIGKTLLAGARVNAKRALRWLGSLAPSSCAQLRLGAKLVPARSASLK